MRGWRIVKMGEQSQSVEILLRSRIRGTSGLGDPRHVALFVYGLAILIGAGVAVQGHWLIAD